MSYKLNNGCRTVADSDTASCESKRSGDGGKQQWWFLLVCCCCRWVVWLLGCNVAGEVKDEASSFLVKEMGSSHPQNRVEQGATLLLQVQVQLAWV